MPKPKPAKTKNRGFRIRMVDIDNVRCGRGHLCPPTVTEASGRQWFKCHECGMFFDNVSNGLRIRNPLPPPKTKKQPAPKQQTLKGRRLR